jgi:hypothetical protein
MTATYRPLFIIPEAIMRRPLTVKAKLVWGQLRFHRNRATGQCNPGYKLVGAELGISETSVYRAVRELGRAGLLASTKHVRASSYVLYESPQPVEAVEEAVETAQKDDSRHVKLTTLDTSKRRVKTRQIDDSAPPASLYEPTQLNLRKGTCAAAVETTGSVGACEKRTAAAAQSSLFDNLPEPERPASPPVAATVEAEAEPDNRERDGRAQVVIPAAQAEAQIAELAQAMALELLKVHPQPGLGKRAAPEIERVLRAAPDVAATAERMWNSHAAWMQYWKTLEAGKFIPQLWRWLRDGDWEQPPVIRKPAERETRIARGIRHWHESKEREERERRRTA